MSVVFNVSNVTMSPKARNCQLLNSTSCGQFCDTEICSQALIIALTSDFIPRMYFLIVESPMYTFEGYVNSTLAVFETSDWGDPSNTTSKEIRGSRDAGFTQSDTYFLPFQITSDPSRRLWETTLTPYADTNLTGGKSK